MRYFIFLILAAITLCSCHKSAPEIADNPYGLPNLADAGTFACRLDNANFISAFKWPFSQCAITNDTLLITGTPTTISAIKTIGITIFGNLNSGASYNINDTAAAEIFYLSDSTCAGLGAGDSYRAVDGTITLTKLDTNQKRMMGTFNCKIPIPGCDTISITNGRFDSYYPL